MIKNVEKRVYTPYEVSEILGLSLVKVYEFLKSGQIPSVRLGNKYLISVEVFDKWLVSLG